MARNRNLYEFKDGKCRIDKSEQLWLAYMLGLKYVEVKFGWGSYKYNVYKNLFPKKRNKRIWPEPKWHIKDEYLEFQISDSCMRHEWSKTTTCLRNHYPNHGWKHNQHTGKRLKPMWWQRDYPNFPPNAWNTDHKQVTFRYMPRFNLSGNLFENHTEKFTLRQARKKHDIKMFKRLLKKPRVQSLFNE